MQAMLENIKHSIVLLQIAKVKASFYQIYLFLKFILLLQNTAHPINGIYNGPMKTEPDITATPGNVVVSEISSISGE